MTLDISGRSAVGVGVRGLAVEKGEVVCFTGPSGAGKTRLLREIADLEPNALTVALDGTSREAMPSTVWRRLVSYLGPVPGWRGDIIAQNLSPSARALATELGLDAATLERPVRELSTGQQQRCHLARILASPREALLLDEPFSALDDTARECAETVLLRAAASGARIVLVTHDHDAIPRLGAKHWSVHENQVRLV